MQRVGKTNLFEGIVNNKQQTVNVIGTWGSNIKMFPIVMVEKGPDAGATFAMEWETGEIVKVIKYRNTPCNHPRRVDGQI